MAAMQSEPRESCSRSAVVCAPALPVLKPIAARMVAVKSPLP